MRPSSTPSRRGFETSSLPYLLAILFTVASALPAVAHNSPTGASKAAPRARLPGTSSTPKASRAASGTKKLGRLPKGTGTAPPTATAPPPLPEPIADGSSAEVVPATVRVGQTLADYIRGRRAAESRDPVAAAVLRRDVERRLALWHPTYRRAAAPVHAALDEALRALAAGWGPYTRNVGYAVQEAAARLRHGGLLPAPDPLVDADLGRALDELETGAVSCQRGMPTTAQLHLFAGRRWLARAEARLPPPPERPAPCPSIKVNADPRSAVQEDACRTTVSNRSRSLPAARVGG